MRVLFDHQIFERQRWGGISRYFVELFRGLGSEVDVELVLERTHSELRGELNALLGLAATDDGFNETFLGGRRFPGAKQLRSIWKRVNPNADAKRVNRKAALARIAAGGFDLFHPTYFDPYFLEALGDRPFVLTIHDFTVEAFPELFKEDPVKGWKRQLAERATRIIAISEHTKRDLARFYGTDPARVDVIHHGYVPPPPLPPGGKRRPLPARYVLFTGTRHHYKNWDRTLAALAPRLRAERDLALVCTGPALTKAEAALAAKLGVKRQVLHARVSEGELGELYARASAFVFPSLYEGFGFPVLEAFWHGCPAALAEGSALPEVGGDAAVYFDPKDEGSIAAAVDRLLGDAALRADLVRRGRERVKAFTWANTCARTLETYKKALSR
jgi:glycosyltransferase involved in cell wall biosynthesis